MFDALTEVEARYEELSSKLGDPEIAGDHHAYARVHKEVTQLEPVVKAFRELRASKEGLEEARELLREDDADMREMAKEEIATLEARIPELEQEIRLLMLPKDPLDEKNIVLEIRAGAGGDESALFSGDLLNMYTRYAQARGWKVEILESSEGSMGGFKEVIAEINGSDVYSRLKFESGVHRVQRVPETEAQGRIHLHGDRRGVAGGGGRGHPDRAGRPADRRLPRLGRGRPARQPDRVGRADHAHPHGVVVSCQDGKSQHQNKDKAMRVLKSRLFDAEQQRLHFRARRGAEGRGGHGRPLRADPDVQLPAEPPHRPPHRPHALQARPRRDGRAR